MDSSAIINPGPVLHQLLNPLLEILSVEVAQAIVDLRADPGLQDRLDDLAGRHHEGQLTLAEIAEYQAIISGTNLIAVLQAQARSVLKRGGKA